MTTTAKVLAELDRLTSNETPPNAVEIATWFALRLPILRAALAPPQEGEVEECAARVREWLPIVEDRDLTIAEFHAMQLKIARDVRSLLRATQAQSLTDAQIVEIRDDHLPSQGEPFDCIAFARAILNASSHEHVYCPHCRPCKHSERVDAYDGVLRGLASYLSAGGFNSTGLIDPEVADAKIRWGIDNFVKVEVDRLLRATQSNPVYRDGHEEHEEDMK